MSDISGTSRAQTRFLRAFRKNPAGPPPDQWPSPVILRRWLKRRGFCSAMNSILRALRYQADFHLTAAAASGAHLLHESVHGNDPNVVRKQVDALVALLRFSHLRARFGETLYVAPPPPTIVDLFRGIHPNAKVSEVLQFYDSILSKPGEKMITKHRSLWTRAGHSYPPGEFDKVKSPAHPSRVL